MQSASYMYYRLFLQGQPLVKLKSIQCWSVVYPMCKSTERKSSVDDMCYNVNLPVYCFACLFDFPSLSHTQVSKLSSHCFSIVLCEDLELGCVWVAMVTPLQTGFLFSSSATF